MHDAHDLHDLAGWIGVHGHPRAARLVARGLRALGRRGGEGAGVVAFGEGVHTRREPRADFLADEPALEALAGPVALGTLHAREPSADAAVGLVDGLRLPAVAQLADGAVALALAGGVVGAAGLRRDLLEGGAALAGHAPEHLLVQLVARSRQRTLVNRLVDALWRAEGGFAVALAAPDLLIAVRDRRGIRPLVLGRVEGATVLATDEAAVAATGAQVLRALAPGEMAIVDAQGLSSVRPFAPREPAPCAQEAFALAPVDGTFLAASTWGLRVQLGEELAREHPPTPSDLVVAADAVSRPAARGYARVVDQPVEAALLVDPTGVRAVPDLVAARRVVLVASALGEALRARVGALLAAGAAEVHVRIAAPRTLHACPFGVAVPLTPEGGDEAASRLGAQSVGWVSAGRALGVLRAGAGPAVRPCAGCVGEPWPMPLDDEREQLPLFGG